MFCKNVLKSGQPLWSTICAVAPANPHEVQNTAIDIHSHVHTNSYRKLKIVVDMKIKRKLNTAQKKAKRDAKAERQKKYEWIFLNGKQVRIKRPELIDGMEPDEFIRNNADPIWLHQNGMHEELYAREVEERSMRESSDGNTEQFEQQEEDWDDISNTGES